MNPTGTMNYVMMFRGGPLDGELMPVRRRFRTWWWPEGSGRRVRYVARKTQHIGDTVFQTMVPDRVMPEREVGELPSYRMN